MFMKSNKNNFIKRLKKRKEDALEYIVDEYLSVWNNSHQFSGDEIDFKKWVCTIVKFKAIYYYRKEAKKVEIKYRFK